MNPHATRPASLSAMALSLWSNRQLITQMTRREVVGRYKGSVMGLLWSFLNPLFMLSVYTFVFSVVFKARWQGTTLAADENRGQFAVVLFTGLLVHGFFSEVICRAPSLILGNVNYVKKIVFPLEIFPIISVGVALFHTSISVVVLLGAFFALNGFLHPTTIFLPLVLLPIIILTLGSAWILASLGVFIRDVTQLMGVLTTTLLFLSPVFFPVNALPEYLRPWMMINPLTFIIEQARAVLIWGQQPHWVGLLLYSIGALTVAWLGYFWFQKTRKGFSDVL